MKGYLEPKPAKVKLSHTTVLKRNSPNPKGPCAQIVYTLAPKHLYGDYFKAKYIRPNIYIYIYIYITWAHRPLGQEIRNKSKDVRRATSSTQTSSNQASNKFTIIPPKPLNTYLGVIT